MKTLYTLLLLGILLFNSCDNDDLGNNFLGERDIDSVKRMIVGKWWTLDRELTLDIQFNKIDTISQPPRDKRKYFFYDSYSYQLSFNDSTTKNSEFYFYTISESYDLDNRVTSYLLDIRIFEDSSKTRSMPIGQYYLKKIYSNEILLQSKTQPKRLEIWRY
jgi:hypothetical protein